MIEGIAKTEKFTLNLADHLIITTPPVVSRFQAVLRLAKHIYKAVEGYIYKAQIEPSVAPCAIFQMNSSQKSVPITKW